jgi:hypothetical protein
VVPETSVHRSVAVRILLEAVHAYLTISDFFSARPKGAGISRHLTGISYAASRLKAGRLPSRSYPQKPAAPFDVPMQSAVDVR